MNSTIGVITMLANRTDTKGPWIKFKKPNLNNLKILDINNLTQLQIDEFLKLYKEVENKKWLTYNKAEVDATRIYVDTKIGEVLNVPSIGILRTMLANGTYYFSLNHLTL